MSNWRGFLTESKSFMSYDTATPAQRRAFWRQFPFVAIRFYWANLSYGIKRRVFGYQPKDSNLFK